MEGGNWDITACSDLPFDALSYLLPDSLAESLFDWGERVNVLTMDTYCPYQVRHMLVENGRLAEVKQAIVNPSDEVLWNLMSSCSNTGAKPPPRPISIYPLHLYLRPQLEITCLLNEL